MDVADEIRFLQWGAERRHIRVPIIKEGLEKIDLLHMNSSILYLKGDIMWVLFVIIFTVVFIFVSWTLYTLAQGDITKIFNWAKYIYIIVFPSSCFMWIYESSKTGKWLESKSFTTLTFYMNLVYMILLLVGWLAFCKIRIRKSRGTIKYGIIYHDKSVEFSNNYGQQRIMMLLVICIVINPIFNIYCVVQFIKTFFL